MIKKFKDFLLEQIETNDLNIISSIKPEDIIFKETNKKQSVSGDKYNIYEIYLKENNYILSKYNEEPFVKNEQPYFLLNKKIRNRIHIPKGFPLLLRGKGLGKKLYQKILSEFSFLSNAEGNRTIEATYIWESLKKDYPYIKIMNVEFLLNNKNIEENIEKLFSTYSKSYLEMIKSDIVSNIPELIKI